MDNHQFYQFAETARRLHHAMVQSDPNAVPSIMAADAVCHALAIEKAIERHQPESMPELTPAIPCTIHRAILRLDPSNPDTWPDDDQRCRYALYNPLSESEDVPAWVIGEGTWDEPSKCWGGMGCEDSGTVNALMLRSVYWCSYHSMSESEFQGWMQSIRP